MLLSSLLIRSLSPLRWDSMFTRVVPEWVEQGWRVVPERVEQGWRVDL